ncbi:hypothetical protein FUA23_20730 [Neolewinella aurantiaca]|uniref:Periplasmic chaperone PpiD n=1 Tax=Neolewinella aurantiaca TaxID=2602767 RepID=A0A5C7F6N1_9BACT|nr:peptidylprolyl isomerase [Neolewinella aurantiaca]TXF85230.1 hypothetical protein FUA23_20730 [Neolewinella aurantiaca]
MALIGKIRQNTLIVLLFIGGGIALFILSEMTSGAGGALGPVMNRMGAVGEREIDRNDFERTASAAFSGGDAFQNRDQLWNFYVNEAVVKNEAEDLGLSVSEEEMTELQYGANPSPVIRRNMTDPNTGQLNTTLLSQIRQDIENNSIDAAIQEGRLNPNFKAIWSYQRREIEASRLQEKMTALMTKAMYAPNWQAQDYANEQFGNRKVAIVKVPFEEVDDTDIEVSDADVQAFIDENRSIFDNPEETRQLTYVTFPVTPTTADTNAIRTLLNQTAADWAKETTEAGDSLFALSNNGTYQSVYQTADRLSPVVADAVMNQIEVGTVFGPYTEGSAMKLLKVIDRVSMPDSAKTRHILRNASTPAQFEEADRVIDSLMNVLQRNRGKFADLAEEFSQDPGSASNGGVYEKVTPGQFVKPFDNVLFRTGTVGNLYKVRTQFGVHLVDIMSRSRSRQLRAKVAYVVEPLIPSSETEDVVMAKAQSFLNGKSTLAEMKAAAESMGLEVKTSAPLPVSNYTLADLGSGQDVKDMMCWAFSADKGDVSPVVYSFTDQQLFYQNNHVVIALADVLPEGLPSAASVKDALQDQVSNRVKGQKLAGMLAGSDIEKIAAQYEVTVDSISSNPTLQSLPRIGQEPKVIAAAAIVATGNTSEPIVGRNGVYFVKPLSDASAGTSGNLPAARSQINTTVRAQNGNVLLPALRAGTDVADERAAADCQ